MRMTVSGSATQSGHRGQSRDAGVCCQFALLSVYGVRLCLVCA